MKISTVLCGVLLMAGAWTTPLRADNYPERPIRMIVAWAAGGGTDIAARTVAKHLSKKLNVPIVVDNRAGASGMIGTEQVAGSPPDGYVIQYTVADSHSVNPHLFPNIRYDAIRDFVPVAVVGYNPCTLVVNAQRPIQTLEDLVAAAKSRPNELTFATWGIGSGGHVRMAALMDAAGIQFIHVPYKGSGPALTAVAGGEVDAMIVPSGMAKQQADAGRVRMLAIDTVDRYQTVPEVKTYKELGFDLNLRFWNAIFAPKGTPQAIADKLNKALNAALDDPEAKADLDRIGLVRLEIGDRGPAAAKSYLDAEYGRWGKVIAGANIRME